MPIIHYTRSNFFVKGGEVTTPTIMGSLFSPCDVMNTLIELNNQLPGFPHTPAHLALALSLAYPTRRLFKLCPLLTLHAGPQNQFFPLTGAVSTQVKWNCQ